MDGVLRRRFERARFRRWLGVHFALAAALFFLGAFGGYVVADPGLLGGPSAPAASRFSRPRSRPGRSS